MTPVSSSPEKTDLVESLFAVKEPRKTRSALGWLLAVAGHALIVTLLSAGSAQGKMERPPLEMEILEPPAPPQPEMVIPPAPEAHVEAQLPRPQGSPPPAARAGALVTAKVDAPSAQHPDAPVDFVTDPNGQSYGGGVVAVGGKAEIGLATAQAKGTGTSERHTQNTVGAGDGLTPLADLSQKPRLEEADPCRGYFPSNALDDVAQVSLRIIVGKTGRVSSVTLLSETPLSQGFGAAARACILTKQFTAALDRSGMPAATTTRINVRFSR
jgi:hypothetical protein